MGHGRRASMLPCGHFRIYSYAIHGDMESRPERLELHVRWRNRDNGEFRPVIRLPPPRQETLR